MAHNLCSYLRGQPLAPYTPQQQALALISAGDRCVAAKFACSILLCMLCARDKQHQVCVSGPRQSQWSLDMRLCAVCCVLPCCVVLCRYAVGTRGWLTFQGRWAWWLKDYIDRAFMNKYGRDLHMDERAPDSTAHSG